VSALVNFVDIKLYRCWYHHNVFNESLIKWRADSYIWYYSTDWTAGVRDPRCLVLGMWDCRRLRPVRIRWMHCSCIQSSSVYQCAWPGQAATIGSLQSGRPAVCCLRAPAHRRRLVWPANWECDRQQRQYRTGLDAWLPQCCATAL